jgi:hypothetical protein
MVLILEPAPGRWSLWGARVAILSSLLVGLTLTWLPWCTSLWDTNYLLQPHPAVRAVLLNGFTRGAVTGLGLVNILLTIHDVRVYLSSPRDRG